MKPKANENEAKDVETTITIKLTKEDVANILNIINGSSFRGSEAEGVAVLKSKFQKKLQDG